MLARLLPKCSDHRSQAITSQPPPADSSPPLPSIAAPGLRSRCDASSRSAPRPRAVSRADVLDELRLPERLHRQGRCLEHEARRTTCTRNRQLHDNAPEPYDERVDSRRSAVCTNVDSAAGPARTGSGVQAGNMGPENSKSSRPPASATRPLWRPFCFASTAQAGGCMRTAVGYRVMPFLRHAAHRRSGPFPPMHRVRLDR